MKRLLKRLVIVAAAVLVTACDFENYRGRELTSSLTVSPREFAFETTALTQTSFQIQAVGDWIIIAPQALTVQPLYGSGDTEVSVWIPAAENVSAISYTLYVCGTDVTVPVVIRQGTEE
ncbi:MAG: hypothetical protein II851_01690 [Bacteroidales bacterium]|nr:hypothetical protein [Bacteroidales bacterium]